MLGTVCSLTLAAGTDARKQRANVASRAGRITGVVNTYTIDVEEGSAADTRRTAALAREVVAKLHKLRCPPSFCRLGRTG